MFVREIEGFPTYAVSDTGQIYNGKTGRALKQNVNQNGMVYVGLMRDGVQVHRAVALLVAEAFVEKSNPAFNSVINLDGDREHNHATNLMWRPRWFVLKYHKQFAQPYEYTIKRPIRDVKTEETHESSMACAVYHGLLDVDLCMSIFNRTYVWPTYQIFECVPE